MPPTRAFPACAERHTAQVVDGIPGPGNRPPSWLHGETVDPWRNVEKQSGFWCFFGVNHRKTMQNPASELVIDFEPVTHVSISPSHMMIHMM